MEEALQTIDIKRFKSQFFSSLATELGDDFFIANFTLERGRSILKHPCRLDGYVALLCLKGQMDVAINLNSFTVEENTLIVNVPGNIFRIANITSDEDVQVFIVAMSKEFVSGIRLDFNKMFNESMSLLSNPCIRLEEKEINIFKQYLHLATDVLSSDLDRKKDIVGAMVSSVFYMFGSIWASRLSMARQSSKTPSVRANLIFDQFLKLVTEFHDRERGVGFYADKLCLSPKYLSKLVKNISGRSAPDWIDAFVILEAKNMLKYSDAPIKEIVFKLNFPNQSVFYKFFKSRTGMTPSEYRNS